MERGEQQEERPWVRLMAAAGLVAGLAVPAACSSSTESGRRTSTTIATPVTSGESSPSSVASSAPPETASTVPLSECTNIGAEQPGYYFNERYAPHIADQLQLLHTAYSPGSNVDISKDGVTYVELIHTMENDPEYSQAMLRASDMVKANPATAITVEEFLRWPVAPPAMCAPQRISDADRKRELQETRTVARDVGLALLGHLSGQTSRLAQALAASLKQELQEFLGAIDTELQQLSSS